MDGLVDNLDRDESKSVEASLTYHEFEQGAPLVVQALLVDVVVDEVATVVEDRPTLVDLDTL